MPKNYFDCKKTSSRSDQHHIPVQRSRTISGLLVIVSLYLKNSDDFHCVKSGRIGSFSGPYFPAFGLNTERYGVSLRIQSKFGKIRTRKKSEYGHLLLSVSTGSEPMSIYLFICLFVYLFSVCLTLTIKIYN